MNYLIHTNGGGMKTPYDDKIAEAARLLREEDNPAYLPQLYKIEGVDLAEAEPEPWPKENPYLKPAVNISADFEPLIKGLARVASAFAKMVEKINACLPIITKAVACISETAINLYPNKRVIHLAKHGKGRTRKKNINRILKYFEREGKKRAVFAP